MVIDLDPCVLAQEWGYYDVELWKWYLADVRFRALRSAAQLELVSLRVRLTLVV